MLLKSSPLTSWGGGGGEGGSPEAAGGKSFHVDNDYRWGDLWGGVRAQINTSTVAGDRGPIRPLPPSPPGPGRVAVARAGASLQPRGGHQDCTLPIPPGHVPKGSLEEKVETPPHRPTANRPRLRSLTPVGGGGKGLSGAGEGATRAKPSTSGSALGNTYSNTCILVKQIVPGCFRGDGPAPCRISSSFLLSGAGVRHTLEARGSWRSLVGSVPVPHGSEPSVARLNSGRAGRAPPPAGSAPAEGLREGILEPREEREKWRAPAPVFPINPAAAPLSGAPAAPGPCEAAAPWPAAFFQALGCRWSQRT